MPDTDKLAQEIALRTVTSLARSVSHKATNGSEAMMNFESGLHFALRHQDAAETFVEATGIVLGESHVALAEGLADLYEINLRHDVLGKLTPEDEATIDAALAINR